MTTTDGVSDPFPRLAEPPTGEGARVVAKPRLRAGFKALNRWFMVPLHRAGLGAWISTPIGGYIVLLRVRGRKSGVVREIPLNYLIAEGSVWVLAGFGPRTEWYRNLLADPWVEARLPGRHVEGVAAEERDPVVRARIIPALLRSTRLPAQLSGINPWTATDEAIIATLAWVPLVRIDADDGALRAGADDPGGRAWLWRQALVLVACWAAGRTVRRVLS